MRARFADCVIDSERHELSRAGKRIDLTPKAFALLEALVSAHPNTLSKADLYDLLWPGVFVETGNLHTLIAEIRSAIADDDHQIIRTVHRFGYALAAEVLSDSGTTAVLVLGDRELPLREGENVIGRELVGTPDVSRRHLRITLTGPAISISDLGSKNGTFVAGKRIESATLHDGDEIMIGRTRAIVRVLRNESTMTAPPLTGSRE